MELRGRAAGITVFDDFAHHPSEIAATLTGAAALPREGRLIAVFEPRSNTMRMGIHRETLGPSFKDADRVYLFRPTDLGWDLEEVADTTGVPTAIFDDLEALVRRLVTDLGSGDDVIIMSNGGFGGIHQRLLEALRHRSGP
jgi:UDP-N-acetylmuramate: L-alanyl-gamma-D-glutamyl-meso-diaminopimelate ligase